MRDSTKAFGMTMMAAAVAATVGLSACASAPPPAAEQIARARVSLERAERAGATQDAATELNMARDKLRQAEEADSKKRTTSPTAKELAEQAELDAEVAEARARADQADKDATELDKNLAALREEAQR